MIILQRMETPPSGLLLVQLTTNSLYRQFRETSLRYDTLTACLVTYANYA